MENPTVANVAGKNPAAVTVTIEPHVAANFQKLLDWKHRDTPEKYRQSLAAFIQTEIVSISLKSAEYVEAQAYQKIERLIFKIAKETKRTPQDVAQDFKGFQLKS